MPPTPVKDAERLPDVHQLAPLHGQELHGQGMVVVRKVPQLPALELAQGADHRGPGVVPVPVHLRRIGKIQVDARERKRHTLVPDLPLRPTVPGPLADESHHLGEPLRQLRLHASAEAAGVDEPHRVGVYPLLAVGAHVPANTVLAEGPHSEDLEHVVVRDPLLTSQLLERAVASLQPPLVDQVVLLSPDPRSRHGELATCGHDHHVDDLVVRSA
mmetsp:Transcript_24001/g.68301  ORF Transcript_24001/g.68301 Transcript_24001/m.68301 type:complete len:215 (+) Transcript_24001:785-1429(+)